MDFNGIYIETYIGNFLLYNKINIGNAFEAMPLSCEWQHRWRENDVKKVVRKNNHIHNLNHSSSYCMYLYFINQHTEMFVLGPEY